MTQEKWENLVSYIEEEFEVLEHKKDEILEGKGSVEYICFKGPLGQIKLERELKPMVIGRKVISSKRIGSAISEEFEYSDTEMVDKLNAYRFNEGTQEWEEIDANQIADPIN